MAQQAVAQQAVAQQAVAQQAALCFLPTFLAVVCSQKQLTCLSAVEWVHTLDMYKLLQRE